MNRIAIVGGGINGTGVAWELARRESPSPLSPSAVSDVSDASDVSAVVVPGSSV